MSCTAVRKSFEPRTFSLEQFLLILSPVKFEHNHRFRIRPINDAIHSTRTRLTRFTVKLVTDVVVRKRGQNARELNVNFGRARRYYELQLNVSFST